MKIASFVIAWLLIVATAIADPVGASDHAAYLKKLPTLKGKPHYLYQSGLVDDLPPTVAAELTRIVGSVTASLHWADDRWFAALDTIPPESVRRAAVHLQPFKQKFGKDLPVTDFGPTYDDEIAYLWQRAIWMRDQFSARFIPVEAVLIECERFPLGDSAEVYDLAARDRKFNHVQELMRMFFPRAEIVWYGRGIQPGSHVSGFNADNRVGNTCCHQTGHSVSLYWHPKEYLTRELVRRNTVAPGNLAVWLAMGASYQTDFDGRRLFNKDASYSLMVSWRLGHELGNPWFAQQPLRFAPWDRVNCVIVYPGPRGDRFGTWWSHFVAYVNGAAGIKSLN